MLVGSPGNCLVCPCVNTALSHLYYQCNQYSSPNTLLHHRRCIFQSQHPIASQMYISVPTPYCITDVYFNPNTLLHHRCIFQSQHPIASQGPCITEDVYFNFGCWSKNNHWHAFEQSNCLFSVKDKVQSGPIFAPLFNMKIEHVLWQLQKLPLTILISF